jgi:hypothetical protein
MTSILENRLAKKIVLLGALIAALAYLRSPSKVRADSCTQACIDALVACDATCDGNRTCLDSCSTKEQECIVACFE